MYLTILLLSVRVLQLPGRGCECCPLLYSSHLSALMEGNVCVSHCSFPPFPAPSCQGFLMTPKLPNSPHAIWLCRVSPFKTCWETNRSKVRVGAVANWSVSACHCVTCRTAVVARAANKELAILHLAILLGRDLKPIPTQTDRFLLTDVSSFPYSVRADHIHQWRKLQSAQGHQLEHEKIVFVGPSASVSLSVYYLRYPGPSRRPFWF